MRRVRAESVRLYALDGSPSVWFSALAFDEHGCSFRIARLLPRIRLLSYRRRAESAPGERMHYFEKIGLACYGRCCARARVCVCTRVCIGVRSKLNIYILYVAFTPRKRRSEGKSEPFVPLLPCETYVCISPCTGEPSLLGISEDEHEDG